MSYDDHQLVPVVNIVPDCQYTQENVTFLSNVASVGLQDLANQANQQRNVIHVHQSYYICGSGQLQWNFLDRRF